MSLSFFGRPLDDDDPEGMHVAVYVAPVQAGRLVAFDVRGSKAVEGRWLPWTILPFGGIPHETAAQLVDGWCDAAVLDLRPIDVVSFRQSGGTWELALVFRAEIEAMPAGDKQRTPVAIPGDSIEKIHVFEAEELRRWLAAAGGGGGDDGPGRSKLVF